MTDNRFLSTKPYFSNNKPCEGTCKSCCNLDSPNKSNNIRLQNFKRAPDRDYVGKYCLVDWLDDTAVIDCSLIHEWD